MSSKNLRQQQETPASVLTVTHWRISGQLNLQNSTLVLLHVSNSFLRAQKVISKHGLFIGKLLFLELMDILDVIDGPHHCMKISNIREVYK